MTLWPRTYLSFLLVAATALATSGTASAQSLDESSLRARLVEFPSSVGPQDSLKIGLEVANRGEEPVESLRVFFSIHEAVNSRSKLQNTFKGVLRTSLGSDTIPAEGSIEPGQSRVISVEKPLSEISAVRFAANDGAYPVRIVVRAGSLASEPIETHMIFFAQPSLEPLGVGLVIPLHNPSIYTDGARPGVVTENSLERSLSAGRLARLFDALEKYPQTPVTLAPSGLLIDMLTDLSNGFGKNASNRILRVGPEDPVAQLAARTLARLKLLAARPNTRIASMPYSAASLGALSSAGLEDLAQAQVTETRTRLSPASGGVLPAQPAEVWLVPIYPALDEPTLSSLQRSGVNRMVLPAGSIRKEPQLLTRAAPVEVETRTGPIQALVEDQLLNDTLLPGKETGPVVDRQRFLADTATLMLERPSQKRAVVVVAPVDWAPKSPAIEGLLAALSSPTWIKGQTVDEILASFPSPLPLAAIAGQEGLRPSPQPPSDDYFDDLKQAKNAIQKFGELAPPGGRLAGLQRRLLIAESADWWGSKTSVEKGKAFARAISPEVTRQMNSIRAPGAQVITLTSRTGIIPLSVISRLAYPVDVVLELQSDKLRFPDGNRIVIAKLTPPNKTVEVRTIAQATGTFPLRVQIQTSTGRVISEERLTIRSTAYNVVAVLVTAGAGLFLLGWWAVGAFKRKVSPAS